MMMKGFLGICAASESRRLPDCLREACGRFRCASGVVLALCLGATGCVQVAVEKQRLVSKPNMEFSDSLVFNYQNKLLPQVEPGTAFSGGSQSSGCAACK